MLSWIFSSCSSEAVTTARLQRGQRSRRLHDFLPLSLNHDKSKTCVCRYVWGVSLAGVVGSFRTCRNIYLQSLCNNLVPNSQTWHWVKRNPGAMSGSDRSTFTLFLRHRRLRPAWPVTRGSTPWSSSLTRGSNSCLHKTLSRSKTINQRDTRSHFVLLLLHDVEKMVKPNYEG